MAKDLITIIRYEFNSPDDTKLDFIRRSIRLNEMAEELNLAGYNIEAEIFSVEEILFKCVCIETKDILYKMRSKETEKLMDIFDEFLEISYFKFKKIL
jgi:hypothetical protein